MSGTPCWPTSRKSILEKRSRNFILSAAENFALPSISLRTAERTLLLYHVGAARKKTSTSNGAIRLCSRIFVRTFLTSEMLLPAAAPRLANEFKGPTREC